MCCWLKLKWKAEHNTPVPDGICALSCTHQAASVRPRPRPCFQLNCMELQSCGSCNLTPLQEKQAPTDSSVQDRPHRSGTTPTSYPSLLPHPHPSSHTYLLENSSYSLIKQSHPFRLVRQEKSTPDDECLLTETPLLAQEHQAVVECAVQRPCLELNSQEREKLLVHRWELMFHTEPHALTLYRRSKRCPSVPSARTQRKFFLHYYLTGFHFINTSRKQILDKLKFSTSLNICISKYKALPLFLHSKFTAFIFN